MVVIVVVALLFLLTPAGGSRTKALRIYCASNLKQIGPAFRIWEGDHNEHNPMEVYTNELGAPLYADSANAFRYFQVMSNELSNPKILFCPLDKNRSYATNFTSDFNGSHISYFIGLDTDETLPQSLLDGDNNLTNGTQIKNGIMEITTNHPAGWTSERHNCAGNVGLTDGSVQQFSNSGLQQALLHTGVATNLLLMP
jgi:hypothetical protein